ARPAARAGSALSAALLCDASGGGRLPRAVRHRAGRPLVGGDDSDILLGVGGLQEPGPVPRAGRGVPDRRCTHMTRKMGYRWHLRQLMAAQGMFATTDLVGPLAERGVQLSREQVFRLVTATPE